VTDVLRYTAFAESPSGGNPAGVVLDARGLSDAEMMAIAAEVGYSETAFLMPRDESGMSSTFDVRYFAPESEIPFCGHATIAAAVALADRRGVGEIVFETVAGPVPVQTAVTTDGSKTATLTSVVPNVLEFGNDELDEVLALLHWKHADLDDALPPKIGYSGGRFLIIAAATRERLADLDYDFDGLRTFMQARDLITVDLVWRESPLRFHARNPFPIGGVVEDPATGAAAAAFGAYLRAVGAVDPPAEVTVLQGEDMGRPSVLTIGIATDRPEIRVSGRAVPIDA
jgi:PhzF family phenazine biosynthesis protein